MIELWAGFSLRKCLDPRIHHAVPHSFRRRETSAIGVVANGRVQNRSLQFRIARKHSHHRLWHCRMVGRYLAPNSLFYTYEIEELD